MIQKLRKIWHNDIFYRSTENTNYLRGILSYIDSEVLEKQGILKKDDLYRYVKQIHELIHVQEIQDGDVRLVRVGRDNDGGYLMYEKNGLCSEEKIAYSLGIADDVSWDLAMADKGYQVFQYDHTINSLPVEHENFHWFKLGVTGELETERLKTLSTLIKMNHHESNNGMLLKCDIEGYEWKMFLVAGNEILKKFDQIIVEFHDILNVDYQKEIIEALYVVAKTHIPIHIHANNNSFCCYRGGIVTPNVLEVTYANKEKFVFKDVESKLYPLKGDGVCNKGRKEIVLGKWNIT